MEALKLQLQEERDHTQSISLLYEEEKNNRLKLEENYATLRKFHENLFCKNESEEEFKINKLIVKIEKENHDKEKMAIDFENEEEGFTNNLQRQLLTMRTEKEKTNEELEILKTQLGNMKIEREKVTLVLFLYLCVGVRYPCYYFTTYFHDILT